MPSSGPSLDDLVAKLEEAERLVEGNEEAVRLLEEVKTGLKNYNLIAEAALEKLSTLDAATLARTVSAMRRREGLKRFFVLACSPWVASKAAQRVMQALWIVAASISFLMGVYLFFPPYVFFGASHGNFTSTIQKTLIVVSQNPGLLGAIDPIFKIVGFVMMAIAIVSLYQAHIISVHSKEIGNA